MNKVLLTVSGEIPPDIRAQVKAGQRPDADYLAMSRAFGADLIDFAQARQITGWLGRLLERLAGPKLVLAWACFLLRNQYRLIFTDGEQIGIPLALFLKYLAYGNRPRHFMIGHILSVKKKAVFFDLFRVHTGIDHIFVYSTYQKHYIEKRWKVSPHRVTYTPFMVDHRFFSQEKASPGDPLKLNQSSIPMICSAGLEFRDYATLVEAVQGLNVSVVIAAASPWSKRKDTTAGLQIPENIVIQRFTQYDLRDLYAASRFVVMPLFEVEFQAGVTTILEAMAMGKAVICSRTRGQTDVIDEGKTGVYVPPGDAAALRRAIQNLLGDPQKAQLIGEAGRQAVQDYMSLEKYTQFLNEFVQASVQGSVYTPQVQRSV
jgi:glycosyltransferase involved in cell wall biosynthesis